MVQIIRIAPGTLTPPQPAAASAPALEAAPLMPESETAALMASGDLGAMISAMLIESGARSRETAREAKEAALLAEEAACQRKIDKMEDEADNKFAAGIAGGIGTALPGITSLMSVGAPKTDPRAFSGSGATGEAGFKIAAASWEHDAEVAGREVAQAEREITQAKRAVESADDDKKDAADLLRRALEHYKEFATAKEDANRAAMFRA